MEENDADVHLAQRSASPQKLDSAYFDEDVDMAPTPAIAADSATALHVIQPNSPPPSSPTHSATQTPRAARSPSVFIPSRYLRSPGRRLTLVRLLPSSAPRRVDPTLRLAHARGRLRKKDIWDHFAAGRLDNGTPTASCSYCGDALNNPRPGGNMISHLLKTCKEVPAYVKAELRPSSRASSSASAGEGCSSVVEQGPFDQVAIEKELARAFFSCALPFSLVDASSFTSVFEKLRPGIKMPSRKKLSNVLLPAGEKECRATVIEQVNKQKCVTLVTDGLSDTNNASIINFMIVSPKTPSLFWSSWNTHYEQHTATYIGGEIERVIAEIEKETTAVVVCVVTDNAKNMTAAWRDVAGRRPAVIGEGCSAHVLNLLLQDVCKHESIRQVLDNAISITKFVRDHHAMLDTFRTLQDAACQSGELMRQLVQPVPTRWYSAHACLVNVFRSQRILGRLFLRPDCRELRSRYRSTLTKAEKLAGVQNIVNDPSSG